MLSNMKDYIDVIIPRGGKGLVKTVQDYSKIPVIGHLEGVCHTYVDEYANLKMAEKIVVNAKMRNTSICGATETLLIHEKVLKKYAHSILKKLEKKNCIIYADKKFKKGDVLKAAGFHAPARNAPRGNVLDGGFNINWTGPLYL